MVIAQATVSMVYAPFPRNYRNVNKSTETQKHKNTKTKAKDKKICGVAVRAAQLRHFCMFR